MALLTLLAVVTVAIVRQRSLFGVVILASIYSFLMASVLIVLDAVDVAMTEASVGAGVSTVLLLATLHLIKTTEMRPVRPQLAAAVRRRSATGAVLVWGTLVLPPFGTADAAIHKHVAPRYLADTIKETNVPNVVTSVLADYRGYDTLGETTVIFTAGIGVHAAAARARGDGAARRRGRRRHEPRSHPARRHQADPAVHPAVRALCAVPRRLRPGRRLPGRRHRGRHGDPACDHLRPRCGAAHRAAGAGRAHGPARRADLCRDRRRRAC